MTPNYDILIEKYLSGNVTPDEEELLRKYLKENPMQESEVMLADKAVIGKRIKRKLFKSTISKHSRRIWLWLPAAAASVLLALGTGMELFSKRERLFCGNCFGTERQGRGF
jgi:transmembrane sensor